MRPSVLEVAIDVEVQHLAGVLVVVGGEDHGEQALDDEGIAVDGELQPPTRPRVTSIQTWL
jgi:hypothetical protein